VTSRRAEKRRRTATRKRGCPIEKLPLFRISWVLGVFRTGLLEDNIFFSIKFNKRVPNLNYRA
jgi:hypothetical protein